MNWKKYSIWYTALSSALILVLCIFLFKDCSSEPECIEIIKRDTITVIHDSIIEKVKWKTYHDTIFTTVFVDTNTQDTMIKQDTLHIPIEYKQATFKTSKDSMDLEADIQYHGYQAEIDTVQFRYNFHYTQEIPKPKQKKFGWCVTIGPSFNFGFNYDMVGNRVGAGPGVGVSVVVGPSYIIK